VCTSVIFETQRCTLLQYLGLRSSHFSLVCRSHDSIFAGYKFDEHDRDSPNLRIQYARFPGPRSASGSRSRRWILFLSFVRRTRRRQSVCFIRCQISVICRIVLGLGRLLLLCAFGSILFCNFFIQSVQSKCDFILCCFIHESWCHHPGFFCRGLLLHCSTDL